MIFRLASAARQTPRTGLKHGLRWPPARPAWLAVPGRANPPRGEIRGSETRLEREHQRAAPTVLGRWTIGVGTQRSRAHGVAGIHPKACQRTRVSAARNPAREARRGASGRSSLHHRTGDFDRRKIIARRQKRDSGGRITPAWSGCRRLTDSEILLLNADIPDSFDGRFFGPMRMDEVVGGSLHSGRGLAHRDDPTDSW